MSPPRYQTLLKEQIPVVDLPKEPAGSNAGVFLLNGNLLLNGSHSVKGAVLALFDTQGKRVSIEAKEDATILVLNGEPIDEAVAREGPL